MLYLMQTIPLLYFNPRSPCGERRSLPTLSDSWIRISIHAPLAGSDKNPSQRVYTGGNFNPRSPCGERHTVRLLLIKMGKFQSTLPLRGATAGARPERRTGCISIHAPLAGSDGYHYRVGKLREEFQSTLPLRGATLKPLLWTAAREFQSTLPLRGATPAWL